MGRNLVLIASVCLSVGGLAACGATSDPVQRDEPAPRAPGDSVPDSGPSGATPGGQDSGDVGTDGSDGGSSEDGGG